MDYSGEPETVITSTLVERELSPPSDFHRSESLERLLKSVKTTESLNVRNQYGLNVSANSEIIRNNGAIFFDDRCRDQRATVSAL